MPAICHILSRGTHVPANRLIWYYHVGTWKYPGPRWAAGTQLGTRVPDWVPWYPIGYPGTR